MDERGLYERDGWSIYEFTREVNGGTELVMRPIHPRRDASRLHALPLQNLSVVAKRQRQNNPTYTASEDRQTSRWFRSKFGHGRDA